MNGNESKNLPEPEKKEEPSDRAKMLYRKAKTLYTQKHYPIAIGALEEAIRIDPGKSDLYLLLGLCQSEIPELKRKAEESLLKSAGMESWNAEPFAALGMLFYSEKLNSRAEVYFRKALTLEPRHALAKSKLAELSPEKVSFMDHLKQSLTAVFERKKK
jgi:tetratricopeptide (TPR) repeat protein